MQKEVCLKHGKRYAIWAGALAVVVTAAVVLLRFGAKPSDKDPWREVRPTVGPIRRVVTTTAVVEPQNRLEIKSPIAGRIEEILVVEGQRVRKGEVLALLSSTERAALLDAATLKGRDEIEYWKRVYRETALIAPIDGEVIVRKIEPGQTVTTNDAVLVLSDRLIVKADVDETDIGHLRVGQKADITLDAYPEIRVQGTVDHIDYESELVNNVNIYRVDILPDALPAVFRSGMSANVDVVVDSRARALLLPSSAVTGSGAGASVTVRGSAPGRVKPLGVTTGIQDESNIEITAGLSKNDVVLVRDSTYALPRSSGGANPFLPKRQNQQKRGN